MSADIGLAAFEFGAFLMQVVNVRALLRDKIVRGVSKWPVVFFMCLGFYQVWAFGTEIGPWSCITALMVACTNATWLGFALYFQSKEKRAG